MGTATSNPTKIGAGSPGALRHHCLRRVYGGSQQLSARGDQCRTLPDRRPPRIAVPGPAADGHHSWSPPAIRRARQMDQARDLEKRGGLGVERTADSMAEEPLP